LFHERRLFDDGAIMEMKIWRVPEPVPHEVELHVDESSEAMARRFVEAWHRAERGETVEEHHLSFESWEDLARVLTGKRLALLRHLRRQPAPSIAGLARALGRDYKGVHADVEALSAAGLIARTQAGLRADYDEIRTRIAV
jgi:predicted transcriptional regulator